MQQGVQLFMFIAKRLKEERLRVEISQPQLGDLVQAGKTTVINWEKGASAPDAVQLSKMTGVGMDVLYIVTGQRSEVVPPAASLPSQQRALINSFELCTPEAQKQLLQLAALLAAGLPAGGTQGSVAKVKNSFFSGAFAGAGKK